jgi:acetyl esterase/lipase
MAPTFLETTPRISMAFASVESFPEHVYLTCGDADELYEPSKKLMERPREKGHRGTEFVALEDMRHGFDMHTKIGSQADLMKEKAYGGAADMINRAIDDDTK